MSERLVIGNATLYHGDCLQVLRSMSDCSVDSVVTDPPYGLSFMGKKWDYDVPGVDVWAECLRVLKPGGHLLAFAGTRTQHRMAVRIEDAGFEIRDMIAWVYGSGFPKSLDVSKAIDKVGGEAVPPEFAGWLRAERQRQGLTAKELCERGGFYKNVNHGGLVSNWEAGLGAPTAAQFNLLCDLLNLPLSRREEVEREVLGWRKVAPGVAFSSDGASHVAVTAPATEAARQWQGWGTALKPALEPITVARKPLVGTVAENVLTHGTGAMNVDGCRVGTEGGTAKGSKPTGEGRGIYGAGLHGACKIERLDAGRWPANLIHDGSDEVVALFPVTTSGSGNKNTSNRDNGNTIGNGLGKGVGNGIGGDTGSAARFFYCAKASKSDRGEGNNHPTVKPTDLMRYLCRLVTPPGGVVLDPFMGSGTTGVACAQLGKAFTGIERERKYFDIACERIARAQAQGQLLPPEPVAAPEQQTMEL